MANSSNNKHRTISFHYFIFDLLKWTGFLPLFLYYRPKRIYLNKTTKKFPKSLIISANHSYYTDFILIQFINRIRRLRIMVLEEIFNTPFKRWIGNRCLCVKINRSNVSTKTIKEVNTILKNSGALGIFPEGKITEKEKQFQNNLYSGIIFFAFNSNTPIIPVYIKRRKHFHQMTKIAVGEAIDINALLGNTPTLEDIEKATKLLENRTNELKHFLER